MSGYPPRPQLPSSVSKILHQELTHKYEEIPADEITKVILQVIIVRIIIIFVLPLFLELETFILPYYLVPFIPTQTICYDWCTTLVLQDMILHMFVVIC